MGVLLALNREGRTVVMVTHDEALAKCARRVVTMRDGQVVADTAQEAPAERAKGGDPVRPADYTRMAASSLVAAPVRSCLTMLGIVIGVAAITSMAAIGSGARSKVSEQIRSASVPT